MGGLSFFYLFDFFLQAGGQRFVEVLVAGHVDGVHACDAVVAVAALAARVFFGLHAVDEAGLVEQGAGHLYGLEAVVQHFVYLAAGDEPAHIDEWHLDFFAELQGVVQEIGFPEGHGGYHPFAHQADAVFQPPAGHVVGHGAYGHLAAHDVHRCFADEAAAEHQCMGAALLQAMGHLQGLVQLHAAAEAVAHVHLDDDGHVGAGGLHDLLHHHVHEAHAVLQRAAEEVVPVVGGGGEELADEVAVAGVYLDGIEPGFAGQSDGAAVGAGHVGQLVGAEAAHEGG